MNTNKAYGKELILDLHHCNPLTFTREQITSFFNDLCNKIDMDPEDLFFWDYVGEKEEYEKAPDHLKGTSAIQFISTSNITVHTLDKMKRVYLNIFSCKPFKSSVVKEVCLNHFGGEIINAVAITRI